jgi:hypothetical protein
VALDQLVFVRRHSPDWARLASDHDAGIPIDPSRYMRADVPGFPQDVGSCIRLWNATFPVNFFHCRQVLKEISERALRHVANAVLLSNERLEELPAIVADTQSLVFFFDDDDLFAPRMFELLSAVEIGKCEVAVFPLVHLGEHVYTFVRECSPRTVLVGGAQPFRYRFHTNNYALTSRAALSDYLADMNDHVLASAHADQHGLSDSYFDVLIGATNKTPCSAVVLRELPPRQDHYRRAIERYLERLRQLELPREAQWIAQPLQETIRLFAEVGEAARIVGSGAQTPGGR